jgi:hypothetical protein
MFVTGDPFLYGMLCHQWPIYQHFIGFNFGTFNWLRRYCNRSEPVLWSCWARVWVTLFIYQFSLPFPPYQTANAFSFWKAKEIVPVHFGLRAFSYSSLGASSAAVHHHCIIRSLVYLSTVHWTCIRGVEVKLHALQTSEQHEDEWPSSHSVRFILQRKTSL